MSRIWAHGVDPDKRTNASSAPESQHEPRGGPEFESAHSGRDRTRRDGVMRFEDAAVNGRCAQIAVIAHGVANG